MMTSVPVWGQLDIYNNATAVQYNAMLVLQIGHKWDKILPDSGSSP